jgi:hypothetical protein
MGRAAEGLMIDRRHALWAAIAGLGLSSGATAAERMPAVPAAEVPMGGAAPAAGVSVTDVVHPAFRDAVARVLRQPTLSARGSSGEVACTPDQYAWLLDHPDRVCLAWKRLRVPCVDITELANGKFIWTDENGSEITWQTVGRFADGLVWYATGKVKATAVLPTVPVRAVAIVTKAERKNDRGESALHPVAQVYLHTDSRAANLILRVVGPTAPKLAEQGAEQLLFFFNGIGNHVARNPEQIDTLLAPAKR